MYTRTKEAIRYLGYGSRAVDDKTLALVLESFGELDQVAEKRIIYRIFRFTVPEADWIGIDSLRIHSRDLSQNLKGCEKIVLLGATLGVDTDRLLRRYSYTDMARAVVLQACAAADLEEYLDGWQEELRVQMKSHGYDLRPRFSPGYGDFSIEHQGEILRMLDSTKKIGLSMTGGNMLAPTKSVTAVIGLGRGETTCHSGGCEGCGKTDCIYRRG